MSRISRFPTLQGYDLLESKVAAMPQFEWYHGFMLASRLKKLETGLFLCGKGILQETFILTNFFNSVMIPKKALMESSA